MGARIDHHSHLDSANLLIDDVLVAEAERGESFVFDGVVFRMHSLGVAVCRRVGLPAP